MSSHALHASPDSATIVAVPSGHHGFSYTTETIEALFHYQKKSTKPYIYKEEASEWPASELTPEELKRPYGAIKSDILFHVKKTAPALPETLTLSTFIEMIEEGKDIHGIIIDADANQKYKVATTRDATPGNLRDTYSSSLLLSDIEKYFPLPGRAEKESHPSRLPPRLMALHITNKHFASGLSQIPYNTNQLIIQTHGQQKVMLMSPDHVQNLPALFNKEGKFDCPQVDLSASEAHLRNERRLANTTFYSAILFPGDILLVPANWLIHQQALSTSVWATFSDECSEIPPLLARERVKLAEQAVSQWAREEVCRHPENHDNIWRAAEIIKTNLYNATYRPPDLDPDQISRLELKDLQLSSFPPEIMQMKHIRHLNLSGNRLTEFPSRGMEHLESLDLSGNRLTEFSICDAKNLELLHLENNQLATFSASNLPNILSVRLYHNRPISLEEDCIRKMNAKYFISLDLENNPLSKEGIKQTQLVHHFNEIDG